MLTHAVEVSWNNMLGFISLLLAAEPDLSNDHRRFLEEDAIYIMTDSERENYLSLATAAERDEFIERFWQVRDPVPETAVNEFREEHFERVREANDKYRESRPGWMTERGRTYITLGQPQDVMSYPSNTDLYPLEVWYYYNLDIPRFPTSLQLMFFKRNGVGEYRLFSPAFDGMRALIADPVKRGILGPLGQIPFSARRSWDIDIIKAAESVGAGENALSSEQILAELATPGFVFEKTRRNLAEKVTATASFGKELPLDFEAAYFRGEGDFADVHLAVEIAPENVHVNQYDERMLGRFDLIGTLRRVDNGELLEEFRDSLEIEIQKDDWETAKHFPVLFQKKLALLPGSYRLELYVRDMVGRGIGIVNRIVSAPAFSPDRMAVSSFLAAFKADEAPLGGAFLPHQFGQLRLYPRPNRIFGSGQRLLGFMEVYYPSEAFPAEPEVSVRFTLRRGAETVLDETNRFRSRQVAPGVVEILKALPREVMAPGDYTLEATLTEPTTSFSDVAILDFSVGAPQETGRLSTVGRESELEPAEKHFREATHYLAAGRYDEAVRRYQVALDYEPYFQEARRGKARAQILGGRPAEGEKTAREALERDPGDVDALTLLGFALLRDGKPAEAAKHYRKALEVGGESPYLLNALGEAEFLSGGEEAAMAALSRSLELQPEQPTVRALLEEVKRSP
jgi:GWxTD domain-containing protein